jgi:hypothetical protein
MPDNVWRTASISTEPSRHPLSSPGAQASAVSGIIDTPLLQGSSVNRDEPRLSPLCGSLFQG